jgi:hypothetical protein
MVKSACLESGRYVLSLEVPHIDEFVGGDLVERRLATMSKAVMKDIDLAGKLAQAFDMRVRSDGITFVQRSSGYEDSVFTEAMALGSMFQTAMLAKGVPIKGVLSFRTGIAEQNDKPLFHALQGERDEAEVAAFSEPQLGIYILPSAWRPYEHQRPGTVALYAGFGNWRVDKNEKLLLNPFMELEDALVADSLGEIEVPYAKWCAPWFPNELLALKFVCDYVEAADLNKEDQSQVAADFRAALDFYKDVLPAGVFEWARAAASSPKWGRLPAGGAKKRVQIA